MHRGRRAVRRGPGTRPRTCPEAAICRESLRLGVCRAPRSPRDPGTPAFPWLSIPDPLTASSRSAGQTCRPAFGSGVPRLPTGEHRRRRPGAPAFAPAENPRVACFSALTPAPPVLWVDVHARTRLRKHTHGGARSRERKRSPSSQALSPFSPWPEWLEDAERT